MDLNKVMIIGRLTRDPELRATPSGINVCSMGVATGFVYTSQATGQKVEQTEFHNITLWRKLGEIAHQYLKKGTRVYIEGRLQTRSWDGQDGQKRYRTEIIADNMIMLDGPKGASAGSAGGSYPAKSQQPSPMPTDLSDEASAKSGGLGNGAQADKTSQPMPVEELPTIQQNEDVNVEDIPF